MNKFEITDEILNKIAAAEFKRQTGKDINDNLPAQFISMYIRTDWLSGAREMLENYNRVVEILGLDNECKCGDHTTDDKLGYDCRTASH